MKYARFGLILVGVIFIFSGCEKPGEPDPPTLISPANGAVFDTLPPAFVWNSDEFADGYKIMIDDDSITSVDCLISIDVEDTTYTMSQETFDTLKNGIYYWVAATCKDPDDNDIGVIAWGESWSFVINKPDVGTLDLDTTYFPFGLGYEWKYQSHHVEWEDYEKITDSYSTFTLTVTDSFWEGNMLFFKLEGGTFYDVGHSIKIEEGKIVVFNDTIHLQPKEQNTYLQIQYFGDTLYMFTGNEPYPDYWEDWSILRIKKTGLIYQGYYWQDIYENTSGADDSHLLYFYNGQDTLYYASQSEAFGSSAKSCTARYRTSQAD